ncbi:MAG: hypothetical protein FF85_04885 [alpha proteobacterium QL1]|nr:MAG: hypothetical protein FF85_04885 [alpha proteobacterium QL1]
MLSAISLSTDNVYLTNIVHFYLEENKQEYLNQKSLLKNSRRSILKLLNQKLFLLGSLPLEILFENQYSLIKNRGQWIQYKQKDFSAEVIASFHPNFLIKQPNQKKIHGKIYKYFNRKL